MLGLRSLTKAKAYSFEQLVKTPVVYDRFEGKPVVLVYDKDATGGRAFDRVLGKQTLVFKLNDDGQLVDLKTGSEWDSLGRCVTGSLKGLKLREMPAIVSFRAAWYAFYPESATYQP